MVAYESEVEQVAAVSGIDLEVKLQMAQTEIGVELRAMLAASSDYTLELSRIVVTDGLRLWHTFHTLAIVYADVYNRKLNDKYLLKWNEYKALDKWARNLYCALGAGVVTQPIAAPGRPQVNTVAGGSNEETTYFVRVTWVNVSGVESGPSPAASVCVPAGEVPVVSVEELAPPATAVGWFPYLGTRAGEERKQTTSALGFAAVWPMPPGGLLSGQLAGNGQEPDYYRALPRTLQRG